LLFICFGLSPEKGEPASPPLRPSASFGGGQGIFNHDLLN